MSQQDWYKGRVVCPECKGSSVDANGENCFNCGASGFVLNPNVDKDALVQYERQAVRLLNNVRVQEVQLLGMLIDIRTAIARRDSTQQEEDNG